MDHWHRVVSLELKCGACSLYISFEKGEKEEKNMLKNSIKN